MGFRGWGCGGDGWEGEEDRWDRVEEEGEEIGWGEVGGGFGVGEEARGEEETGSGVMREWGKGG